MRLLTMTVLVVSAAVAAYSQDQAPTPTPVLTESQRAAHEELNRAAAAYKAGNFIEAQQHTEYALSLDPANKTGPVFLARMLHQRFKPGDDSHDNVEVAREAIAAYQKILSTDPLNEEAYQAIAVLYA